MTASRKTVADSSWSLQRSPEATSSFQLLFITHHGEARLLQVRLWQCHLSISSFKPGAPCVLCLRRMIKRLYKTDRHRQSQFVNLETCRAKPSSLLTSKIGLHADEEALRRDQAHMRKEVAVHEILVSIDEPSSG
ncbi:hypothetical protein FVER53590_25779 [Fusarium verticillioides]|nr:hypothetical protein FVER53590_25779 [Fusarium verticillioides]